jgi:hypothetical protein
LSPKLTVCGETGALSAMLMLPPTALVFGGVKVSLMVQAEPAATSVQSSLATTDGSDERTEATVRGALPQLVTFTVCDEEVFTGTLPKPTLVEFRHTDGAGMLMSIFVMKLCCGVEKKLAGAGRLGCTAFAVVGKSTAKVRPPTMSLSDLSTAIPAGTEPA